jgi:hypothetical protein
MKKTAPLLFLAILALTAPAVASARPDHDGGGGRGEGRGWGGGGGRWGGDDGGDRGGWQGRGGDRGDGWRGRGGDWPGRAGFAGDDRGGPDRGPPPRGPNSLREGYGPQQDEARRGVREGGFVPLPQVLNDLRRRTPGRQLDTGIEDYDGRPSYRVRWVDQSGRRMDFIVDARTGAVLSVEGR